uniref:Dihydroorotase n=1 Tax=uncultured Thiotrichaceae bacterium TaxID=298394 RepID=A0A6S6UHM6_9GAMM|nr:MAG: Dihydroorotase (EC [uncultured Thiotrichaceae bacterium]
MGITNSLTITQPDDWHLHLRSDEVLQRVLPYTSRYFGRAIVMPNLQPPVIRTSDALAYREQIFAALPEGSDFKPLMTLYMTEQTDPADVKAGYESGDVVAVKLYPAGATTNSDAGVKDLTKIYPVLAAMEEIGMPLLIHGEVVDADIDIFDREAVFIETKLIPVREQFPKLKIVLEHLTTKEGVDYVQSCAENTAATITPHHLVINRNALLVGGIKPHYYCLPVAKRESHRLALRAAATSGDPRFFLGTDSAPHLDGAKETACGCAGIFNVANTVSVVAEVFEQESALDKLEGFLSLNGPAFYGLPVNTAQLQLTRSESGLAAPEKLVLQDGEITHFDPMMDLHWGVAEKLRG